MHIHSHTAEDERRRIYLDAWLDGEIDDEEPDECPHCQGTGFVLCDPVEPWRKSYVDTCSECGS
jgi:DnaJ-class molecular chaperone